MDFSWWYISAVVRFGRWEVSCMNMWVEIGTSATIYQSGGGRKMSVLYNIKRIPQSTTFV